MDQIGPPVHCSRCGLDFESRGFRFTPGGAGVGLIAGSREECPRCGALAKIADGAVTGGGFVGLARDVIDRILAADDPLQEAQAVVAALNAIEQPTPEDIVRHVPAWLGDLLPRDRLERREDAKWMVEQLNILLGVIIAALVAIGIASSEGDDPNAAQVREAEVRRIVEERLATHPAIAPPAAPAKKPAFIVTGKERATGFPATRVFFAPTADAARRLAVATGIEVEDVRPARD